MAKSNYGFVRAGGVRGVQQGIEGVIAGRVEAQKLAHQQFMAELKAAVDMGNLDVNRADQKQRAKQWEVEAPSQIALRQEQAAELVRRPNESLKDHERRLIEGVQKFTQSKEELGLRNQYELGQIGARADREDRQIGMRGAQDRLTNQMDPSNKAAAGEHLPAAAQTEVKALNTIEALVNEITTTGNRIGWEGVGGGGMGSVKQALKQTLNIGSDEAQALRANIGNLRSSVSGARAGLTLTPNEERMLDSFIGTMNSHPQYLQVNMQELMKWVNNRRASNAQLYKDPTLARSIYATTGDSGIPEYVRDATGKLVPKR